MEYTDKEVNQRHREIMRGLKTICKARSDNGIAAMWLSWFERVRGVHEKRALIKRFDHELGPIYERLLETIK